MRGRGGPTEALAATAPAGTTAPTPVLRVEARPPEHPLPNVRTFVADTTWSPGPDGDGSAIGLRDVAGGVLARRDFVAETTELLDRWTADSGVVGTLTVEGTSFWHYYRLRHWTWLQEQLLWLAIAAELLDSAMPEGIEVASDVDPSLVEAIRLVAGGRGIAVRQDAAVDGESPPPDQPVRAVERRSSISPRLPAAAARSRTAVAVRGRLRRFRTGVVARVARDEPSRRRRFVRQRLTRLGRERNRLLVVLEHARQRVETPTGARRMNAYLGPVVDRLRGTALEPIEIDIRTRIADDAGWSQLTARASGPGADDAERLLPADAIWLAGAPWPPDKRQPAADAIADTIAASPTTLPVGGVDMGPRLAAQVAADARRTLAGLVRNVERVGRLLDRLRPAGILLADEYHRQEWLAAAAAREIPVAAIQHGLIWRGHAGYVHPDRPPGLRLPDRTYVFGRWEADVLRRDSVFREEEVVVAGSPRLDLVAGADADRDPDHGADRDAERVAVRRELGVATDARMVVISGTWSALYRRFHYPISLAALVDRPLPRVHLVVKLHPGEPDEGPYRTAIERAARAGGHEPPLITVVRDIDLYALLRAADAHVGIHSTVLTEAVWAGTPNLLVDFLPSADLLGYVAAGVARPIRCGSDLLAALDDPDLGHIDEAARRRFLDAHFEPGNASDRIAADLLAWLPPDARR